MTMQSFEELNSQSTEREEEIQRAIRPEAHDNDPEKEQNTQSELDCRHLLLTKHWDSVADMGKADKISSYSCNTCGAVFSPEEAEQIARSQQSITL